MRFTDEWLASKAVSLWPPMQWDLTDPKERADGVAWFEQALEERVRFAFSDGRFHGVKS